MVSSALRRAIRLDEQLVVPRVSDLEALVASTSGKVEFETPDSSDKAAATTDSDPNRRAPWHISHVERLRRSPK